GLTKQDVIDRVERFVELVNFDANLSD
ncbi:MAG: hypothetical protein ACI9JY_002142, partial [Saprospiraceae bacterium]